MTIPNPSSPAINENIGSMITNLAANMAYLAGGTNVNFTIFNDTKDMTAGSFGNYNVGFEPDVVICIARCDDGMSWGVATSSTATYCMYYDYNDDADTNEDNMVRIVPAAGEVFRAIAVNFKSDGFDVAYTTNVTSGTLYLTFLVIG